MKFLIMGDMHEREKAPKARIDDWQQTLDNKAEEIQEIALKNKVTAIIQCGDFLDSPKMGEEYLQTILKRWNKVTKASFLKESDITNQVVPMYGIIGNHELFGNSMKNFSSTSLSLLSEIGFIKLLSKDEPLLFDLPNGRKIAFTGSHYNNEEDYMATKAPADVNVHIVHGMLTDKDLGSIIKHTRVDEIADKTCADVTISGHEHTGFEPVEINGKWFLNPGAVTRLNSSENELARDVCVYIMDVKSLKNEVKISFKKVKLKSALKSKDVLTREHINTAKEKAEYNEKIKDAITNNTASKATLQDIVNDIANDHNIGSDVKKEILDRFSEALKNSPDSVQKTNATPYTIKKLILTNFQSYEDGIFEFDDKLNVLTGSSGSGKTSVLRAFSWIYENKADNARNFIKHGKDFASAKIILSNGVEIERMVQAKKSGFNGYIIKYADGTTEKLNTRGTEKVQELLGFNYLHIENSSDGKKIPLNFMKQGDGWFFIGDNTSSPDRAKIIGSIYKTYIADNVHKEIELDIRDTEKQLKNEKLESVSLEKEINGLDDIEAMGRDIDIAKDLLANIERLTAEKELIAKAEANIKFATEKMALLEKVIDDIPSMTDISIELRKVTKEIITANNNLQFIDSEIAKIKDCKVRLSALETIINDTKDINGDLSNVIKNDINKLNIINENIVRINNAKEKLAKLKVVISDLDFDAKLYIEGLKDSLKVYHVATSSMENFKKYALVGSVAKELLNVDFDEVKRCLKNVADLSKEREELKRSAIDIQEKIITVNKQAEVFNSYNKRYCELKESYNNTIKSLGYCPLCHQHLTDEAISQIAKNKLKK